MLSKLKIWFDSLSSLVKVVTAIVAITGAFTTFMIKHDKKVIDKYIELNKENQTKQQFNSMLRYQRIDSVNNIKQADKIDSMANIFNAGLHCMIDELILLKKTNENLERYLINNVSTKQDVLRVQEIFEQQRIYWYDTLTPKISIKKKGM